MSYERFFNGAEYASDPGYFPDFDPEDEINSEHPLNLLLANNSLKIMRNALTRLGENASDGKGVGFGIGSLNWATTCVENGFPNIVIVIPGSPIALRVKSRIIEAPIIGKVDDKWVKQYLNNHSLDEPSRFPCPPEVAEILFDIEQRTGVKQFRIIGNHGIAVFDVVSHALSNKYAVAALNEERTKGEFFPDEIFESKLSYREKLLALAQVKGIVDLPPVIDP